MHTRLRGRAGVHQREQVRDEEPFCRHCMAKGRRSPTTQVDHIIPLFKGGTNDRSNLQGLCDPCHSAKSARDTGKKPGRPWREIGPDGWPIGQD